MDDPITIIFSAISWIVIWGTIIHKIGYRKRWFWGLLVAMCIPGVNAVTLLLLVFSQWPNNRELKAARKELGEHRKAAATKTDIDAELRRLQGRE
ncbi:MAG: hypothetical protein SAJ12_07300 [Jaaginema sp. PMC 1079.18]|nr:hypothetical protein [Jaaginema sp. PMC 1080.18]MEC4850803.1 hypothetical protein [Jaaginema sp. PMC 1079.18]MEC4868174.1 hypothetical protein [Jaaginema sp. PMC 1078.18]